MKKIFTLIILFVVFIPLSSAQGKQSALDLGNAFGTQHQWEAAVEQQNDWPYPLDPALVIINPVPGCAWSINDYSVMGSSGYLDPGASQSTITSCQVAEQSSMYRTLNGQTTWWSTVHHTFGIQMTAPSPNLILTVCYQPQNRCFSPTSIYNSSNHLYGWSHCSKIVYDNNDSTLALISGSHGDAYPPEQQRGRGVATNTILTILSTDSHRIKDINVTWGISSDFTFAPNCPINETPSINYPFIWN